MPKILCDGIRQMLEVFTDKPLHFYYPNLAVFLLFSPPSCRPDCTTVYPNNAIVHQEFGRYSAVKIITKPRGVKMQIIENSAGKKTRRHVTSGIERDASHVYKCNFKQ